MSRLVALLAAVPLPALAGTNSAFFFTSVPTLDEVGLGVLIGLVGAAAGWAVGRRKRRQ